ncbi:hypothetical protein [Shimia sagamensis]|uniref:Alpha/beta hydrolase n=1 Tax=Shimia sagamensis TaxID=1566352 RepID=A0ABY1PCW0_9RHOB|nr:hypothetical protein [Shimia sagamensis]SMP31625.1 hypothetical protein SAMN06265373_10824 [Shimia sagamensis]
MSHILDDFEKKWPALPGVSLFMAMCDSAPTLLEWVLHHRILGFGQITIYGDGANSEAEALCCALHDAKLIRYIPTKLEGLSVQKAREQASMEHMLDRAKADRNELALWLAPEDFVVVSVGEGRLLDLADVLPPSLDLLSLTTQMVGGSRQLTYQPEMLMRRFDAGTGTGEGGPVFATSLRTLFRPSIAASVQPNRPKLKPKYKKGKEALEWLDGAGHEVFERYREKGWRAPKADPGFGHARVVSFASQDPETWLLRKTDSSNTLRFITPEMLKASIENYSRFNFLQTKVSGLDRDISRLEEARDALFEAAPSIRDVHNAVVEEFGGRLERLLVKQDPQAIAAINMFLSGKLPAASMYKWDVPMGVETTLPPMSETASIWAAKHGASKLELSEEDMFADENDVPKGLENTADMPDKNHAPNWLSDLRLSGNAHGFYHSMPNYACSYVARSQEHLLISFDNLSSVSENPVERQPWGYGFVQKAGWSHLGVMTFVPGWYRDETLHEYLISLRDSGFFTRFQSVTLFGTSMGAYAACAFASLVPGCRVAAFSPQSTLSKGLVPWEPRYPAGRRANWAGAFVDASKEVITAEKAWIFYDPHMPLDVRHVERFKSPNVIRVPLRNADHKTALVLRNGGVLSKVVRSIVEDEASVPALHRLYRQCRTDKLYGMNLLKRAKASGGQSRQNRVELALRKISTGHQN